MSASPCWILLLRVSQAIGLFECVGRRWSLFSFGQAIDKKVSISLGGEIDVFQCFAGLRVETNRNDMSVALCTRCVAQQSVL